MKISLLKKFKNKTIIVTGHTDLKDPGCVYGLFH